MHAISVCLGKKSEIDSDSKITRKLDLDAGITAILDYKVGHDITKGKTVAHVSTDYFGGCGDQHATVTKNGKEIYSGNTERGSKNPINEALKLLGVEKAPGKDEFDTVGLGNYRTNEDFYNDDVFDELKEFSLDLMKLYTDDYILSENEYLLKIRKSDGTGRGILGSFDTGFLSKLTQKGQLPKSFDEWGKTYHDRTPLPVYVFEEKFRSGWKLLSWRFGQSQNWARVIHPFGFTLEIYLQQFLEIMQNNTVINGEIQGEFMWKDNKLIKKC